MSTTDYYQSQKSVQSLIGELVSALYLRPWIDEAEERHELKREIIRRVKAEESDLAYILELLTHHDWAVRDDAAEMLGWVGNKDAVKPLLALLWKDRSKVVRGAIAMALERIGTPEGLAAHQEYEKTIRSEYA
jgi:HEAT repeat protein